MTNGIKFSKTDNLTLMLIAVSLMFVICQVGSQIWNLVTFFTKIFLRLMVADSDLACTQGFKDILTYVGSMLISHSRCYIGFGA